MTAKYAGWESEGRLSVAIMQERQFDKHAGKSGTPEKNSKRIPLHVKVPVQKRDGTFNI